MVKFTWIIKLFVFPLTTIGYIFFLETRSHGGPSEGAGLQLSIQTRDVKDTHCMVCILIKSDRTRGHASAAIYQSQIPHSKTYTAQSSILYLVGP